MWPLSYSSSSQLELHATPSLFKFMAQNMGHPSQNATTDAKRQISQSWIEAALYLIWFLPSKLGDLRKDRRIYFTKNLFQKKIMLTNLYMINFYYYIANNFSGNLYTSSKHPTYPHFARFTKTESSWWFLCIFFPSAHYPAHLKTTLSKSYNAALFPT